MRDRYRYRSMDRRCVTHTRLPALVIGSLTAYDGKLATVTHVEERAEVDGGKWVVRLEFRDRGKPLSLSASSVEATLPVFHPPFPVCSCHGDPWPCNDAHEQQEAQIDEQREEWAESQRCAACGQEHNLGGLRYIAGKRLRYCRRVGCVREAERAIREAHNGRVKEQNERKAFAAQMTDLLANDERSTS